MAEPAKYGWRSLGEIARTVASVIGVFTIIGTPLWKYVLSPALISNVSVAVAQSMDDKINSSIDKKVSPINAGLKAIIQGNIAKLKERIDILEYKRDFMPMDWTNMDREELYKLGQELDTQQRALNEIQASERNN